MIWRLLFYNLKAGALSFGGGIAMIPLLQHDFVVRLGMVTNAEFLDAIAVGQITPGPLMIFVAFIGYRLAGISGSLISLLALFFPSLIFALLIGKLFRRYRGSVWIDSIAAHIGYAAVGLLGALLIALVIQNSGSFPLIWIAVVSFFVAYFTQLEPFPIIVLAAVLGLMLKA
jgi:chromate transporter